MKASTKIFLSCLIILISAITVAIFFSSASKITLVIYNPVTNISTQQKSKKGQRLIDVIDIQNVDGYEFYDFYTTNFEQSLGGNYKVSKSSDIVVLGYVKEIDNLSDATKHIVGVKYSGKLSETETEQLFSKNYHYIDLSQATISGAYPSNNTSIESIKFPQGNIVGINNFTNLKTIECEAQCQISNAFDSCINLENVNISQCISIESSFNNCTNLTKFSIGQSLCSIDKSFIETPLNEVINNSDNFVLENNVLYQKDGQSLVAKKGLTTATNVDINSQTTKIDDYAFYNHSNIKKLVVDAKVSAIGEKAFYQSSISEIEILQDNVLTIESHAFANCANLENISWGRGINRIEDFAFYNCKLNKLEFESNCVLTHVGAYAFSNCGNLSNIKFANNQITIAEGAFANCQNLLKVENLNTTDIPTKLFENCKSLSSLINFSEVKNVGNYAFSNCQALSDISELNKIQSVGIATFANCISLTEAKFVNLSNLTTNLFLNCKAMTTFASAEVIDAFDKTAFDGCKQLATVSILGDYSAKDGIIYNHDETEILYYIPTYNNPTFQIKSTVKKINIKAVTQNPYIQQFSSMSDKFVSIDGVLFNGEETCLIAYPNAKTGESYSVPVNTKEISAYAFSNTQNLNSLEINEQIQTINCGFLWQNLSLQSLKVPFIGKSIQNSETCFLGWFFGAGNCAENNAYVSTSLKIVEVYNQTTFQANCFYDCENLLTIKLSKCGEVENMMFYCCYSLQTVDLGAELTRVGDYAFYNCKNLSRLYIVYSDKLSKETVKDTAFENTPDGDGVKVQVECEKVDNAHWELFKNSFRSKRYSWTIIMV